MRGQYLFAGLMLAGATSLTSGCVASVRSDPATPVLAVVSAPAETPPVFEVDSPTSFESLPDRTRTATNQAKSAGATLTAVIKDRASGAVVSNGNNSTIAIASVAKLFIADDLLMRESQGEVTLTADDRAAFDRMLQSSDDSAAEIFWQRGGGNSIITRVAARYGLASTTVPSDGMWWNTISTANDLVQYYDMLLSGTGGLPPERANIIVDDLSRSTPNGIDGYPQRFGIPDGIPGEPVAVKQGWMCCVGSAWMHLSTGVVGPDRRFIVVVSSLQTANDVTARNTLTQAVATMFPGGRIETE
ncbi:serine hydrolase [Mycobacteroides franklinii]|uniref:serine hydrolase n=1 Tax=Mycobacteroides franklinii TaxID=948102 RepID=UPI0013E8D24A|nr:lipoprotein LppW [Mycobacteroides franklinii]